MQNQYVCLYPCCIYHFQSPSYPSTQTNLLIILQHPSNFHCLIFQLLRLYFFFITGPGYTAADGYCFTAVLRCGFVHLWVLSPKMVRFFSDSLNTKIFNNGPSIAQFQGLVPLLSLLLWYTLSVIYWRSADVVYVLSDKYHLHIVNYSQLVHAFSHHLSLIPMQCTFCINASATCCTKYIREKMFI